MNIIAALLVSLAVTLGMLGVGEAAGPVNPKNSSWIAPIINTDGTPLTDLGGYNAYVATVAAPTSPAPPYPGTGWTRIMVPGSTVTVIAPSPAPTANFTQNWPLQNVPGGPGQKYFLVTAVDLTGVESAGSAPSPFVSKAPGAPSNVQLLP